MYETARLTTIPGMPMLRHATHEQIVQHSDNVEAQNVEEMLRRFGPDDEHHFYRWAAHHMMEHEDYFRQCGLTFAWVDPEPMYIGSWECCWRYAANASKPNFVGSIERSKLMPGRDDYVNAVCDGKIRYTSKGEALNVVVAREHGPTLTGPRSRSPTLPTGLSP